ncbi:Putative transcriptional regulator YcgE (modular protein) [Acidobacteriia bacterium SbA2]|nr:Putative transcriptional regulator YcgE (modular protein) [Acidobacteriia bacterium SbA2]
MSTPDSRRTTKSKSGPQRRARRELLDRLWDLGRIMSTQTVFLHQAIAQSVGLNATDTKCIDLILRGPGGSVTAGWLSEMTGLTTGAITHILDRLEKRRFVERVRDTEDRRKVYVRVRPESLEPLTPKYEAIGRAYLDLMEEYSDKDLQLICEYMEKVSQISERELAKLISPHRVQRSQE